MFTFFSSSDPTAQECSLAMNPLLYNNQQKRVHNWTDAATVSSRTVKAYSRLHNVMLFFVCCIASGELAQIHGSISKMKMEIQKIGPLDTIKGALAVAFVQTCAFTACANLGIFVKGDPGPTFRKQHGQGFFFFF